MRPIWRLILAASLMIGCVGCDQATKSIARAQLTLGDTHSYLGDTFRLVYSENPGAFLSMGATLSKPVRIALFQGMIALIVLGLLWAAVFKPKTSKWQTIGLTLLAASGTGNLIDRLLYDGRVTDFINIGIGSLRTGIFNIADAIGMIGVAVFLLASRETVLSTGQKHSREQQ
jgi:signal peptidase II